MNAMPSQRQPDSADEQEIRRTLHLLLPNLQPGGEIVEARLIYDTTLKRTDSGYFDNVDALASALLRADQQNAQANPHATGLYLTLNRVDPALIARANNRIVAGAKRATRDANILWRVRLLLDVDAVRPSGISSTDGEHDAAIDRGQAVRQGLLSDGWPECALVDSGNAAQLVYGIDLPNDEASKDLLQSLLATLALRFDTPKAKIDPLVFDASRCFKAAGTVARKGDHTDSRPHRMARLLTYPPALEIVPRNLIEDTAQKGRAYSTASGAQQTGSTQGSYPPFGAFDVNTWLAQHNLSARGPIDYKGGWKWTLPCPFDPSHHDSAIIQTSPLYLPAFSCFHTACKNAGHDWNALNRKFNPNYQAGAGGAATPGPIVLRPLRPGDLYDLSIPKPELLIEECIPRRGAVLFTGVQKVGKTIMSTQIAIAVATGQALFSNYRVLQRGPVMIMEQDDPAGAASVRSILQAAKVPRDAPICFVGKDPSLVLGEELIRALEAQIASEGLVLVVLDSYTALRAPRKAGGDIVKNDQSDITLLDELGKRAGCALIMLHHDSNSGRVQRDWASSAAGTFGLTMATEGQIHIARYPELSIGATERHVRLLGRHLKTTEMVLRFDENRLAYDHILSGEGASLYPQILDISTMFGKSRFTVKDFCQQTGGSRSTGHRAVLRLLRASILRRHGHEYWLAEAF